MAAQAATTVFCYAYRPICPVSAQDVAFAINLDNRDQLRCSFYMEQGGTQLCTSEYIFQLDSGLRLYLMRMINYAMPWLQHVPQRMQGNDAPEAEYTFGFHGVEAFRIYDLDELMGMGFTSSRGHYSRKVYCLMEDIAALFATRGIMLTPEGIRWEGISPVEAPNWALQA